MEDVPRRLMNTDPTCRKRLWSYDRMAP